MHKLAKGLKKKKKPKKGKKGGEEEEFDPEELERYRRERAEAQRKAEESGQTGGSDEWKKFQALTAGVDSVLKKTQDDLDRIKSTSFFQRKAPLEEKPNEAAQQEEAKKLSSKRWVGFDAEGNPIEAAPSEVDGQDGKEERPLVNEDGFVDVPEDEDEQEDSAEEDIFDTTYVDVLQNIDVQLAYIPDSPTEEEAGDDPFDTTSADKVLKTVDKKGNKLVSLGNAVEVLSGRIDHVSTCKLTRGRRPRLQQDLLLDDFEEAELPTATEAVAAEPIVVEKTLLDDDSDLPDIPVDLTKLPPVLPRPATPVVPATTQEKATVAEKTLNGPLDISEFEVLKEKTVLEEIPDLDDAEFDLNAAPNDEVRLEEADDPFAAKEPETVDFQTEIIEASFEAATFVDEADPFDTTFADNILPGKTELKFIEKELEELPVSEVSISLTDPSGFNRDYETGLLKLDDERRNEQDGSPKKDLLGGSATDLSQLADQPIAPVEEITYVDPFDTSTVEELPPGKTELKVLEKELLGEESNSCVDDDFDDDFDPRKDETSVKQSPAKPPPPKPSVPSKPEPVKPVFEVNFEEDTKVEETKLGRKTSRPEILELAPTKAVAFELPTPSKRPDLLATSEEEKTLPSKPLTPYYTQKSIEDSLPVEEEEVEVDPFDTSFVSNVAPGKTELKLIESELLKQEPRLPHSLSDHDFDPRSVAEPIRRQSDFTAASVTPGNLKLAQLHSSLIQKVEEEAITRQEPQRQESLLDAEVEVDAKPLTPRVESKPIEEEEISYADPFDTSIATNILPGKAELKILESELQQIPQQLPPRPKPINLPPVVSSVPITVPEIDDFDPRADEAKESKDFLSLDGQDPGDKVLTPLQNFAGLDDDVDPFDTSFATIEPGRTELKLLESELMK